ISLVTGIVELYQRLEEPGSMAEVPAGRAHEFGGLNYIIFHFQRRDNSHRLRPHLRIQGRNVVDDDTGQFFQRGWFGAAHCPSLCFLIIRHWRWRTKLSPAGCFFVLLRGSVSTVPTGNTRTQSRLRRTLMDFCSLSMMRPMILAPG